MPRLWLRRLCATGVIYACTAAVASASWAAGDRAGRADSLVRRCFEYAQAADGSYNAVAACDGAFRSTLNRRDRTATFVNRAIVRSVRGDYDGALDDLDRAEALKPELASTRVTRGQVYIRMARWRDAEAAFSEGIALGPEQPEEAYFGRGVAREGSGDVEGAYADYRAAARLAPDWRLPREQLERFKEQPLSGPTAKV